jgi:multiple sugar transport system permease protein
MLFPMGAAVYFSLSRYDILRPPDFIGLGNFIELARDRIFANSIGNTFYYALLAVPSGIVIAFVLALLLNKHLKFRSFWRTIFYLPSIVPIFVTAQLWRWIYHQQYGLINSVLQGMGLQTVPWLGSPDWSKISLAIIGLWACGGAMVIFLAALQDVPRELIEVAQLDSASSFQQIRHITIPLVTPQILFLLLNGLIGSFQTFALPQIMTGGGPVRSTEFMVMYLYNMGFGFQRMGYAAAISWIVFLLTVVISIMIFRTSGRWVYYSGESRESI